MKILYIRNILSFTKASVLSILDKSKKKKQVNFFQSDVD